MKRFGKVLICMMLIAQFIVMGTVFAADISGVKKYKPLDMVVVVDTSGSMEDSDATRMTPSAVNMLINMMPAEDSRIGVVTFNKKPTALTTDAAGNPALLTLKEFENAKSVKQSVAGVVYKGGTGIGNAVKMATDILSQHSTDDSRQKAIILFTDGMDDFGVDQLSLAMCKENQSSAVQWATENNCPIYCIGYNYKTTSGQNSMGEDGEGLKKLESIAKPTDGKAQAITSIEEIEELFINILANICDLYYKPIQTVPGDGKEHIVEINVSPEVVEANIRIACPTKSALSKGKIELINPDGAKVPLQNGNGIRYDVDATAASIKVLAPKTGMWTLVLNGIEGEEIKIGLLEHYDLGIVSTLTLPEGNPEGVAYVGDQIGVQTYLTTDGSKVSDNAIYETVTEASVVIAPRVAPDKQEKYALTFDGSQYVGSFPISYESVYDVTVQLSSQSFIRTENLTIQSSNHPLILDKKIGDVKLNKNKQLVISDIYTYVSDPEQDAITAQVTHLTDPDMAKAEVRNDEIVIDGLGWGATNVTVTYTDAHGNTVDTTFKVSVNDPVAWAIIIGLIILIIAIILLAMYLGYKKTIIVRGSVYIKEIGIKGISHGVTTNTELKYEACIADVTQQGYDDSDAGSSIEELQGLSLDELLNKNNDLSFDPQASVPEFDEKAHHNNFEATVNLKQHGCKNMYDVMSAFVKLYEDHMTLNGSRTSDMATDIRLFVDDKFTKMREIGIFGTRFGKQGIVFKLVKNPSVSEKGFSEGVYKTNTDINETTKDIEFVIPTREVDPYGGDICYFVKFDYKNAN